VVESGFQVGSRILIQIIPLFIFLYGIRLMILRMRENQKRVRKVLSWIETRDPKILEELKRRRV
jgi:hypothetical protein